MTRTVFALLTLLFVAASAGAQQSRELLRPINDARSRQLDEYNSSFLKEQTYFASRYRIVEFNADVLFQEQEITVTPFEDIKPIELVPLPGTPRRIGDEHIFWSGRYRNDPLYEALGTGVSVTIAANSWDLEPSGDAVISSQNRFEFSPQWSIDEAGKAVLERSSVPGQLTVPGEPPRTAEQIRRHKRLQSLDKQAFYSVDAVFDVPGGSRYVLKALKYSPRYAVIYEIPRDTVLPGGIDAPPTAEEQAVFERYKRFVETLPNDSGKSIRGDVL